MHQPDFAAGDFFIFRFFRIYSAAAEVRHIHIICPYRHFLRKFHGKIIRNRDIRCKQMVYVTVSDIDGQIVVTSYKPRSL